MIKEWVLTKLLKNRIVFFEQDDEYHLIDDICFDGNVVVCSYYDRKKLDPEEKELREYD